VETRNSQILELLSHPHWCFSVPPYQRPYEWNIDRWHGLVQDVLKAATQQASHWIGIFLTAESMNKCSSYSEGGTHFCWELIDGQQRLITIRLLLQALKDHLDEFGPDGDKPKIDLNAFYAQSLDQRSLNEVQSGKWRQRKDLPIKPSNTKGVLTAYLYFRWLLWLGEDAILSDEPLKFPSTSRKEIHKNLDIWAKWELALRELKDRDSNTHYQRSRAVDVIKLLDAATKKLTLLELRHQPQIDETPDVVFASLNGKRMELEEFDHVRNFVFSNCLPERRSSTYDKVWKPAEYKIREKKFSTSRAPNLETFLYDYLIAKGEAGPQKGINRARSANQFIAFWRSRRHEFGADQKLDDFVCKEFAQYMYLWISSKSGDPIELMEGTRLELSERQRRVILRIDSMSSGPFTPLILGVLADGVFNERSSEWLSPRLNAIEATAARHLLLGTNLSPFRTKTMQWASQCFGRQARDILEVLAEKMPKDSDVRNMVENFHRREVSLGEEDFAKRLTPPQICAIFDGIEEELSQSLATRIVSERESKESGFSVEHIYPQDAEKWSGDLKSWGVPQDRHHLMARRVHELGNITVLPKDKNIKAGNHRFEKKKEKLRGLRRPALNLDKSWIDCNQWTTEEISHRTQVLVDSALKHWPIPPT
jgi:hypothetical protein